MPNLGLKELWANRSPAARLAASYVAIIMTISLAFSLVVYRLSMNQLALGLRHHYLRLYELSNTILAPPNPQQIEEELARGSQQLQLELLYFNFIILILASVASYWLAKRTLRPIEHALDAQSRFTADASHELRTPLTAMQAEIEVALRDPDFSPATAHTLLESNLEEVAKLRSLSDGLLQLARQEGDGEPLALTVVSLADVASTAANQLAGAARSKRIAIGDRTQALLVRADRDSLLQVAVILIDNAIKYSPARSSIELTSRRQGKMASLTVRDHGPGIAPDDLPHIFDRFYRADRSRTKSGADGYGLGLAIAKKIIDLHGGRLHVHATPGHGATFMASLPLASK